MGLWVKPQRPRCHLVLTLNLIVKPFDQATLSLVRRKEAVNLTVRKEVIYK